MCANSLQYVIDSLHVSSNFPTIGVPNSKTTGQRGGHVRTEEEEEFRVKRLDNYFDLEGALTHQAVPWAVPYDSSVPELRVGVSIVLDVWVLGACHGPMHSTLLPLSWYPVVLLSNDAFLQAIQTSDTKQWSPWLQQNPCKYNAQSIWKFLSSKTWRVTQGSDSVSNHKFCRKFSDTACLATHTSSTNDDFGQ